MRKIILPLLLIAARRLPLSLLPYTPLARHTPEESVTDVSDDAAEDGNPLSKFSSKLSAKAQQQNKHNAIRV